MEAASSGSGVVQDSILVPAGLVSLHHLPNRRCEVSQSGGLGSLRAVTADKIFVELHFVLATKRFNVRSMRKQRLLVIVISPDNFSCWCFILWNGNHQSVNHSADWRRNVEMQF